MIGILRKKNGMNIVGQGGKIILFTLPSLIVAVWVHARFPQIAALPASLGFLKPVGYLLLIPGLALWLAAIVQLMVGFSKGELVTTCAYGVVRNPIYSSVAFFVLPAITLLTWTWVYAVASIFLYLGVMIFIGVEEKQLTEVFGEEYRAYVARVDRMIPWKSNLASTERTGVMSKSTKIVRLVAGTLLVLVIASASLALLRSWTLTWGATEAEVARTLPGDELVARTPSDPTHAATIDAPPEEVWPWIAQMGDDRGGFYSYTFIENLMTGEDRYHNANRILPQFQNPQPGDGIIFDSLKVYDVEPGKWLLAVQSSASGGSDWVWLWHLEPVGSNQTRLLVRNALHLSGISGNSLLSKVMSLGAYVMEWRMIEGIKLRAEGRTEPAGIEAVEIVLWVAALVAGLGAARLFLTRPAWQVPLLLGLAALFTLVWFTVWLPSIWLRLLFDIALLALLWWVAHRVPRVATATEPGQRKAPASPVVQAR
jgi:protein-S-isoprenylcysteine O-methyltransferase Ste14